MGSEQNNVIVAHNTKPDAEMLNKEEIHPPKVICTLKLARHLDSAGVIPKYNLQYLRYYLGLKPDATAHDALGDIMALEAVPKRIQEKFVAIGLRYPNHEMIKISSNPILTPRMPFGMHKGMIFSEVPADCLEWLPATDLNEDMAYIVKHYLGQL